jgi:hypothetical protein
MPHADESQLNSTNRKMNKPKKFYRINNRKKPSKWMQNQNEYAAKMFEKIAQIEAQLKDKAQQ